MKYNENMNPQLGKKWFTFYTKVRPFLAGLMFLSVLVDFLQYKDFYLSNFWMIFYFLVSIVQVVLCIAVAAKSDDAYYEFVRFVKGVLIFETISTAYAQGVQQYIKDGFVLESALVAFAITLLLEYLIWYRLNMKYFKKRLVKITADAPKTEVPPKAPKEEKKVTHYEVLQVMPTASPEVIRMAYKALASKYHPDVFQGNKEYAEMKMKQINEAYSVLSSPVSRQEYDRLLQRAKEHTNQTSQEPQPRSQPRPQPQRQTPAKKKRGFFVFFAIILILALSLGTLLLDDVGIFNQDKPNNNHQTAQSPEKEETTPVDVASQSIGENKLSGEEIFQKLSVSTVEITAESDYISSLGTGFYIDDSGTVVTNYHVIEDCSIANVTTSDGGTYEVTSILGYDKDLDIAILSTSKTNSTAVKTSSNVTTGEAVYVLGSSLGLTGTFSEGLVSAAERNIGNNTYIQISAPISNGNSGGPVANALGEVIGIASAGFEDGQNLNLALPISVLNKIALDNPMSMEEFYETTSAYYYFDGRVVELGSTLAVRTITLDYAFDAESILREWKRGKKTEETMVELMDKYGADQGGGQLYIIDPGTFVEEIDKWCFSPSRQPGDCAVIVSSLGYSICYISMLNE